MGLDRLSCLMMCCAYCEQPATIRIVSNPEQVCFDHAMEFWTGLMLYVRDTADTCVKQEVVHLPRVRGIERVLSASQRHCLRRPGAARPRAFLDSPRLVPRALCCVLRERRLNRKGPPPSSDVVML